jgi:ABC-type bacteriocin/lantibiotic exporter with double-glycine peptidase domain
MHPIKRILEILRYEKKEIWAIYFYAIFSGLVQLSLPIGIQSIISFVLGGSLSTSLVLLIVFVVSGVFISGLLQVNQMKIIEKIEQQLFVRYSFSYAYTIPKINLLKVDSYYLPELVNRFFDTVSLQKGLAKLLLEIPTATIQILFGLILLSLYHPIFIFFGISLVIILYLILRYSGTRGLQTSIEESNYKYNVAGWLEELARVVNSLKFSRGSQFHLYKTDQEVTGYLKARTNHFKILLFQYWSLIVFKVIITASMLIVGSFLLVNQQLNIGQFIAAEIVIIIVMSAVEKLIGNLDKVYDVLTSVEKLSKVMEKPVEVGGEQRMPENLNRGMSISIRNLNFGYEPSKPTLQNISMEIASGEKVCLMGENGSGKSTLLRLLTGAYQPYTGGIIIDGIPLNQYDLDSLRAQTGILLESQEIFDGTLVENITLGNEDIPIERILRLAEVLGLKEYIDSEPEGLQLMLHPSGKRLSRKIIQRVLLLRALAHQPRLLLLEEPWLGLSSSDAANIKNFLLNELSNVTIIVSTNDEDFARSCNKRFILQNGTLL